MNPTRSLVAGGAGFLGSHLCDRLLADGGEVVCIDDLSTGSPANLNEAVGNGRFSFIEGDVIDGVDHIGGTFDQIWNLASPASPPAYLARPIETMRVGAEGTRHLLERAERDGARFILASTSEIYGDPYEHPQLETYWGNVNSIGPRSVYDEAKRYAEALTMAYGRERGVRVGIVRIFNTYGPRLNPTDGRMMSNFISQALAGEPLTIYGDGSQTRSLCFVSDLVDALVALAKSDESGPINAGNPDERTVLEIAQLVIDRTGSKSSIIHGELPVDDPVRRCPDIGLAQRLLGWQPRVSLDEGLSAMIDYMERETGSPSTQQ